MTRALVVVDGPEAATRGVRATLALLGGGRPSLTLLGLGPEPSVHIAGYLSLSGLQGDILRSVRDWLAVAIDQIPDDVPVRTIALTGRLLPTLKRVLTRNPHDVVVICMPPRGFRERRAALRLGRLYRVCPTPVVVVPLLARPDSPEATDWAMDLRGLVRLP